MFAGGRSNRGRFVRLDLRLNELAHDGMDLCLEHLDRRVYPLSGFFACSFELAHRVTVEFTEAVRADERLESD